MASINTCKRVRSHKRWFAPFAVYKVRSRTCHLCSSCESAKEIADCAFNGFWGAGREVDCSRLLRRRFVKYLSHEPWEVPHFYKFTHLDIIVLLTPPREYPGENMDRTRSILRRESANGPGVRRLPDEFFSTSTAKRCIIMRKEQQAVNFPIGMQS